MTLPAFYIAQRVLLAVGGGYALTSAAVTLAGAALAALGVARGDAVLACMMLGVAAYVAVVVWAFAERRLGRLWLVLGGGALLGAGLVRVLATAAAGG